MREKSMLKVKGPSRNPTGPKYKTPPITERKIKNGCICTPRLINLGPMMLSTKPTKIKPQQARPKAERTCWFASRKISAGIITSDVPIPGIKAEITVTLPQRTGLGIPNIKKPIVANTP